MPRTIARLEAESASLRERLQAKTAERDALQNDLRERERGLETARMRVLQLLGEVSTLRNQVVQIDEYLAAIERDSARARKEEEIASGDLARLDQVKAELSTKLSAQQLELESLADRRHRVEEDLKTRQAAVARLATKPGGSARDAIAPKGPPRLAGRDSFASRLHHRIGEAPVHGHRARASLADSSPRACWRISSKSPIRPGKKRAKTFLHEELEYVVVADWAEAERGVELMRAESDGRVTFLVNDGANAAACACNFDQFGNRRASERCAAPQPGVLICRGWRKCFLVRDHAAAQRLASEHPDCYFLLAGRRQLSRPRRERRPQDRAEVRWR